MMTDQPRGYRFGAGFVLGNATTPLASAAANPNLLGLWVPYWEGEGRAPGEVADRAQNTTLVDGDPFAVLTDWSVHGNHATQADAGLQPVYSETDRALVLAGAGGRMDTPPLALDYGAWVYAVYEATQLTAQGFMVEHGDNAGSTLGFINASFYGAGGRIILAYPRIGITNVGIAGTLGSALPGAYQAVEWQNGPEPDARSISVNGVPITPLFNGNSRPNQTNTLPLRLFARFGATPTAPLLGRVRFLAVGTSSLSAGGKAQVRALAATVLS